MRAFSYHRAADVREALAMANEGARYLGGGTNLVDLMKTGVETPTRLVDVRFLPLAGISQAADELVIGATTTNSDLAAHPTVRRRFPALSQAVLAGASGQLRNMATVAGNLLQRTRCGYFATQECNKRAPGTGCPAIVGEHHNHAILGWSESCVATHPSDMAVALLAFDAIVHVETLEGPDEIPLADFYPPVGDAPHVETTLPPGALITAVRLRGSFPHSRYRKVRERASYAFATVSVAACLDGGSARIALGGVASRPWRARRAEAVLLEHPGEFHAAAEAELAAAEPLPGNGYKLTLARNLIVSLLNEVRP
ncbi:xanthine dehydrogenase family protein subunit M [Nonomuraea wenchangensis]